MLAPRGLLKECDIWQDKQYTPAKCAATGNPGLNRKVQLRKVAYSIGRIHAPNVTALSALVLPMGLQNRIPPSPAEADCANLIRAGRHTHGIDEAVD